MTARSLILARLAEAGQPLPIHALNIKGVSQTAASARLREMRRENLVVSVPVPGQRFTAWALPMTLPLLPQDPTGSERKDTGPVGLTSSPHAAQPLTVSVP